jgi:hypothetical protein
MQYWSSIVFNQKSKMLIYFWYFLTVKPPHTYCDHQWGRLLYPGVPSLTVVTYSSPPCYQGRRSEAGNWNEDKIHYFPGGMTWQGPSSYVHSLSIMRITAVEHHWGPVILDRIGSLGPRGFSSSYRMIPRAVVDIEPLWPYVSSVSGAKRVNVVLGDAYRPFNCMFFTPLYGVRNTGCPQISTPKIFF